MLLTSLNKNWYAIQGFLFYLFNNLFNVDNLQILRYCKKLKNIIAYHIAKVCSKGWLHVAFLFESYNFFNGLKVKNEFDPYRRHIDATVRLNRILKLALREKCPYSEFFWSVFSPNAGKYGPEKLWTQTLFTQCCVYWGFPVFQSFHLLLCIPFPVCFFLYFWCFYKMCFSIFLFYFTKLFETATRGVLKKYY